MADASEYTKHVGCLSYEGPHRQVFAIVNHHTKHVTISVMDEQALRCFQKTYNVRFYGLPHVIDRKEALDLADVILAHLDDSLAAELAIDDYCRENGIWDRVILF